MKCNSCFNEIRDGSVFCEICGARQTEIPAKEFTGDANTRSENSYDIPNDGYVNQQNVNNAHNNAYGNSQNAYNNQNSYGYTYNPYQYPGFMPMNNKTPEVKEYLQWMLVYPLLNLIPLAGFVIYLVFCINFMNDKSYPARANYFKATLISWAISAGIGFVFSIFMMIFAFFFLESAGSLYY